MGPSACLNSPTGPSFDLAGTWRGTFDDLSLVFTDGTYISGNLTIVVHEDGSMTASGVGTKTIGPVTLSTSVSITGEVYPDGAVSGTATYQFTQTGYTPYVTEGEIVGHLESSTLKGSGVLSFDFGEPTFHLPWTVTRR